MAVFSGWKLTNWMELLALLPATLLLAPVLLYGGIGMILAMFGVGFTSGPIMKAGIVPVLLLLAQMLVGIASLACLWVLLLAGVRVVRSNLAWRWLAAVLLVLGIADATHFLFFRSDVAVEIFSSVRTALLWVALLIFPMLVGARYLLLLFGVSRP